MAVITASDLLARPEVDDEPSIPPGLLADLHDPHLIITDEYVGPDPRMARPPAPPAGLSEQRRPRARSLAVAVALTAAVVAPLTLAVSHPAGPAPAGPPAVHRAAGPLRGR